jgi:hypothetical protein
LNFLFYRHNGISPKTINPVSIVVHLLGYKGKNQVNSRLAQSSIYSTIVLKFREKEQLHNVVMVSYPAP